MLSVTCDNVSCNDKMVEELAKHMMEFPRQANCTCCFAHIINLVAKSLLKQFDLPENKAGSTVSAAQDLQEFVEELEMDSTSSTAATRARLGYVDEREGMLEDELEELVNSVQLVQLVLMKVRSHTVT